MPDYNQKKVESAHAASVSFEGEQSTIGSKAKRRNLAKARCSLTSPPRISLFLVLLVSDICCAFELTYSLEPKEIGPSLASPSCQPVVR